LKGKERNVKTDISTLFLGDENSLAYVSKLIYADKPNQVRIGAIFIWNLKKKLDSYSKDVDMVIIKTDLFFSHFLEKKRFLIIPEWIEMSITIPGSLKEFVDTLGSSAKKDIKLIDKFGYSYEISKEDEKLDFFYRKMCIPYLVKRHGQFALLDLIKYSDLKRNFKQGSLLLVKDKDKYIAGSMIVNLKNVAYPAYMGILDDSYYLPRGIGATLYYFPLSWAEKCRINSLNFGNTRTFLKSGDFQYKRKWKMTVNRSKYFFGIYGLMINQNIAKGTMSFLENNPFICANKMKLKGIIFLQQPLTYQKINSLWKKYYTSGFVNLSIFSFHNFNNDIRQYVKSNYKDKIVLIDDIENIS
jgi:hypothetical protein